MDGTVPSHVLWAQTMFKSLKAIAPNIPRTISLRGPGTLQSVSQTLKHFPPSLMTVVDVHLYGSWQQITTSIGQILALRDPRPLIFGETGMQSYSDQPSAGDQAQLAFYSRIFAYCANLGLPLPAPWMYSDLLASGTNGVRRDNLFFGLRRLDGSWKPAAGVVREYYTRSAAGGTRVSNANSVTNSIDGDFEHEAAAPFDSILGAWNVGYLAQAARIGTAQGPGQGGRAAFISGATGTHSQVPAVYQTFPIAVKGTRIQLSALVNTRLSRGRAWISLAYFDQSGVFIGSSASKNVQTESTWQTVTLSSRAPNGAAYAEATLCSYHNPGTVYFDKVTLD